MSVITFVVYGVAQPKGSTRSFGFIAKDKTTGVPLTDRKGQPLVRTATTSDNARSKGWQQLVAEAASRSLDGSGSLYHGPMRLFVVFHLPRPKSLPKTRPTPHIKKPDLSKLIRSTEDALTGVLWRDDAQVVDVHALKSYAGLGESPRAVITVEPLAEAERIFDGITHGTDRRPRARPAADRGRAHANTLDF